MFECLDDTIVAISSAPGRSPRGIVRLSGPEAHALGGRVFAADEGPALADARARSRLVGRVWIEEDAAVPAEAYSFRAPASYTRQDLVELHTIGAPPVLAMILDRFASFGARPAAPGEFTARAFLSGAMDLTCVEGVAAMIAARNDAQLRASEALLHGRLSQHTSVLREHLGDLLSLIEADIDFAEEPIDFISRSGVAERLNGLIGSLSRLVHEAPSVERLEVLPTVLLTGPPNTGKSTLCNRLTGMDRVIQSAVAGTTRDIISAPLNIGDGEVLLLDSAGLLPWSETAEARPSDAPEQLAQQFARRHLRSVDLVVIVADINAPFAAAWDLVEVALAGRPWHVAANKIDTVGPAEWSAWIEQVGRPETVTPVSAHTGEGIERLTARLNSLMFASADHTPTDLLALSNRQRAALQEALQALQAAHEWFVNFGENGAHTELLALHIREATNALSLLEGRITTEDLLDRIFSRFCIGK